MAVPIGGFMINFAHRGASEYAPENTMVSFHMGIAMGADGIETDVQRTRDGVLVLFHDDTLRRIFSIEGSIHDYTWKELSSLDAGSFKGVKYKGERLVRLEEFLRCFGRRNLKLAIEIKESGIEDEVLSLVRRFTDEGQFTITSFMASSIEALSYAKMRPSIGYLARSFSLDDIDWLCALGVDEYCPAASDLTDQIAREIYSRGMRIRAWGVKNVSLMDKMIDLGIYGMTVNFPDILHKRLVSLGI